MTLPQPEVSNQIDQTFNQNETNSQVEHSKKTMNSYDAFESKLPLVRKG